MADTMQFDLVSPERKLASVQAREVRIPGADGDLTAMPGHAALITTLRPGILTVVSAEGSADYAVTGGFAEIGPEGVTVLAERGLPKTELTPAIHAEMMAEAKKAVDTAHPSVVDAAVKMLADMEALGTHMTA
ncbi:ATP synthase F1 subunit epsilon [Rhodobacter xanthinilyticus]|uniref:ATP synthase epsilon chain n=1 Tax=Rhodobacter xanthinilyticus TaxID=1850250 RepID=A0A1D9MA91_9RHOB|nr:F0F1 ATP synthase subunit epsilon [Rhodobacter xanthinilyticus]AOZ68786.1 ATP synthase F1 subunit epsilon [Rhodobacter xanthinilyticus]